MILTKLGFDQIRQEGLSEEIKTESENYDSIYDCLSLFPTDSIAYLDLLNACEVALNKLSHLLLSNEIELADWHKKVLFKEFRSKQLASVENARINNPSNIYRSIHVSEKLSLKQAEAIDSIYNNEFKPLLHNAPSTKESQCNFEACISPYLDDKCVYLKFIWAYQNEDGFVGVAENYYCIEEDGTSQLLNRKYPYWRVEGLITFVNRLRTLNWE
jgi:hypothetical protein